MADVVAVSAARRAYAERAWQSAFDLLSAADRSSALGAEDLEMLGNAAYLLRRDDDALAAWTRAHNAFLDQSDRPRAARIGFWLSLCLLLGGQSAQSGGWLSKCQRLLGDHPCAEHGLLLVVSGLFSMFKGRAEEARAQFARATELGERFGDPDLLAAAVLGHGQLLIQMRRADEGVVLLDEAMVKVTSGQATPIMAGIVYCGVILTCERISDVERAHEWTVALDRWCGAQPELVAFRGQCLVHRAEVMLLRGAWEEALCEAVRACEILGGRSERLAGRARYQQGELHRLTGNLERAAEAFRDAAARGFEPEPGASLLRLARGDGRGAAVSIRRAASEAAGVQGPDAGLQRIRILGPFVEIMLAVGAVDAARSAAEELEVTANEMKAPSVRAIAAHAVGSVQLATGAAGSALEPLREAWSLWQRLEAPFEAARARVLLGRACEQLGEHEAAALHLEAATSVFERLGAQAGPSGEGPSTPPVGAELSARERQVLGLVAVGKTNREIAQDLDISKHTVARHISNIFHKIGVRTRTAASAFAFEHDLV